MSNNLNQSLGANNPLKTRRVLPEDLDIPLAGQRQTGPLDAGLGAPWVVELHVHDTPLTIRMEVKKQIIIGRVDVESRVFPDIDLTPYGGLHKGVSRQHALLAAEADRLLIMDLGSTNGTYINEQRLQPREFYRLRHGDDIRIGEVAVEVRLELVPLHDSVVQGQPWVRLEHTSRFGSGQRVMIVENNPNMSTALATIITRLGFDVQVASEMAEAFYMVTRRLPDVIVINLDVSSVNGLELCRYIQRLAHKEYVPLIIISQDTQETHVQEIMNAGADVFLGKPVGVNELARAIAAVTRTGILSSSDSQTHQSGGLSD